MAKDRRRIFALVLAPLLLGAACTEPPPPAQPTATAVAIVSPAMPEPTVTPATPTVRIGVSVPLSGPAAKLGIASRNFIQLALDEINARGGVKVNGRAYRFAAVVVDDQYTADGAGQAGSRLLFGEQARFILGTLSVATAQVQAMAEQNKVLLLSYSAADSSLGPSFPMTFQTGLPHVRTRLNALYQVIAAQHPSVKRVLAIDGPDAVQSTASYSETAAQNVGLAVVASESVKTDATDFTALARRIIAANPDALDFGAGAGPAFLVITRTLHDEGFRRPAFGLFADAAAMRDAAPFVEGYVAPLLSDRRAAAVGAEERALAQRYVDRFGERELDLRPIAMYNVPFILADAMVRAGTVDDTAKLAQTLREGDWDTIWSQQWGKSRFAGTQTLGLAQILEQPVYFSKIENGRVLTFRALKATLP